MHRGNYPTDSVNHRSRMNEVPECFRRTQRVARKDHHCCECRGWIRRGEKYTYLSGIWGGEPGDYKVCPDCIQLRFEYDLAHPTQDYDELPAIGGLGYCIYESDDRELIQKFNETKKKRQDPGVLPGAALPAGQDGTAGVGPEEKTMDSNNSGVER
jgi:hypothetical protein